MRHLSSEYDAIEAPPRSRRKWLIIAVIILVPIGVLIGTYFYVISKGRAELREALAEVDRLDPHWTLKELEERRVTPPDEQNSALRVLAAKAILPGPGRAYAPLD